MNRERAGNKIRGKEKWKKLEKGDTSKWKKKIVVRRKKRNEEDM